MWWLALDYEAIMAALTGLMAGVVISSHSAAPATNNRQLVIPAGLSNECRTDARVNGHVFSMLLDTGATGRMTFGRNHARDLGFDPARLAYSYTYGSANGDGHLARVRLREFRLASFVIHDVEAEITDAPQSAPLLGLDVLHRLSLQLKDGNCILTLPAAMPVSN
jgi:clan AA aspartic protease (TIGR02281 family)